MPQNSTLLATPMAAIPPNRVSPQHQEGTVRQMLDRATVPANFANDDFIAFGAIPSTAVIMPISFAQVSAGLGAGRTLAFRVRDRNGNIGPTLIAAAADASAAGKRDIVTRPVAEWGRQLWFLAGFTTNPGGRLTLEAVLSGGAGPASAWDIGVNVFYT